MVVISEASNECKGSPVIWVDCIVVSTDGRDSVVEACINDWTLSVVGRSLVSVVSRSLAVVLIVSWSVPEDTPIVYVPLGEAAEVMPVHWVRSVCGDEVLSSPITTDEQR